MANTDSGIWATFREGMELAMFIGREGGRATQEQYARLREEVVPLIRDKSLGGTTEAFAAARLKTIEIMGTNEELEDQE